MAAARIERRALFVGIMVLFAGADLLAAVAPNLPVMVIARLIPALTLPVFWSVASATAARLVPPERAGRAVRRRDLAPCVAEADAHDRGRVVPYPGRFGPDGRRSGAVLVILTLQGAENGIVHFH